MFLSFGILIRAILLVAGIIWCVAIIRRLPDDISELREHYRKYRTRHDPKVLETMRTEERRQHYQENCASDFWTTLSVNLLFFWSVTAIVLILVLRFVIRGILLPILSSFR